jgi:hypothetical protein
MRSRITYAVIVAAAFLLCQFAADPGAAKVVRDSTAPASNPAVATGGLRLPPQRYPGIPYSFLGAMELQGNWLMRCALWPWQQLGNWGWFRHRELRDARRIEETPRFEHRFGRTPHFDHHH